MNNNTNNGQYNRSRPVGGFYEQNPLYRPPSDRTQSSKGQNGYGGYYEDNRDRNGSYGQPQNGNGRNSYGQTQGGNGRNSYAQPRGGNNGNPRATSQNSRNPYTSSQNRGSQTSDRRWQNEGRGYGQAQDNRRRQYDPYSYGNSNWNNENYRKSVKTARTTTRVIVAPRRKNEEKSSYYYDDTIGGAFEQRKEKIGEIKSNVMAALRRNRRFQKLKRTLTVLAVSLVILSAVLFVIYKALFVVSDITVTGNTKYTQEQIVEASGIGDGVNLYSFSSKNTNSKISFLCPSVLLADFTRTPPNKINIGITEEDDTFYANIYGDYYTLSDSLRITGRITPEEAKEKGLALIRLQSVLKAVSGSEIVLESSRANRILNNVIDAVNQSGLKQDLTLIDLTEDFEIMMGVKDMYRLEFGTQDNIDTKLMLAESTLSSDTFSTGNKGYIYLSDTKNTRVIIDNQVTFDK